MPRRRPAVDRLPELVNAAVGVFAQQGYRATQMADVAAAMGVAPGSLYNYVEGKEGLFALCVEWVLREGAAGDLSLPVATPALDVTLQRLRERADEALSLPVLRAAVAAKGSAVPAQELAAVVSELYDLLGRTRQAADMIERSARDLPELAALFRDELRTPLLDALVAYLGARMASGQLRQTGDVSVTARFVLETVTWFARHRFHDSAGTDVDVGVGVGAGAGADEATVRTTVIDLIVSSLAAGAPPVRTGRAR